MTRAVVLVVGLMAFACGGGNRSPNQPAPPADASGGAPAAQDMAPNLALGLWKSNFGPVKIEIDPKVMDQLMGVWVYDRSGVEVIGFFSGPLKGNVLQFSWHEPGLAGAGYLVFDPSGNAFSGRWWTTAGDKSGDWTGQRTAETQPAEPMLPDQTPPDAPPPTDGPAEPGPPASTTSADYI